MGCTLSIVSWTGDRVYFSIEGVGQNASRLIDQQLCGFNPYLALLHSPFPFLKSGKCLILDTMTIKIREGVAALEARTAALKCISNLASLFKQSCFHVLSQNCDRSCGHSSLSFPFVREAGKPLLTSDWTYSVQALAMNSKSSAVTVVWLERNFSNK